MTTDQPWRISANQREQRRFDVVDNDQDDVDITGWVVDAKVRTRPGGQVLHEFPENRAVIEDGQVVLTIPAPVSAAWAWTTAWYRIRVTDPSSSHDDPATSRVLEGALVVDPD